MRPVKPRLDQANESKFKFFTYDSNSIPLRKDTQSDRYKQSMSVSLCAKHIHVARLICSCFFEMNCLFYLGHFKLY